MWDDTARYYHYAGNLATRESREYTVLETTRDNVGSPGNPSYPALYPSFFAPERREKKLYRVET